jgi:hypothetical protein
MVWPTSELFSSKKIKNPLLVVNDVVFIKITRRTGEVYITCMDYALYYKVKNLSIGVVVKKNGTPSIRVCNGYRTEDLLHRVVLDIKDSTMLVDHINHNPLDNRLCNLRVVTVQENGQNMRGANCLSTTGYRGVSVNSRSNKYIAHCTINYKYIYLGLYKTVEEANIVVSEYRAAKMPFSEDARKLRG